MEQAWLFVATAAWVSLFWCIALISVCLLAYNIKKGG